MIAIALFLSSGLTHAAGIPYDVEALVKRADACATVWSSKSSAANAKFTSIEIQEKNEEILTTHRCSTLAANVISTCLKYDQDPHLKQICGHLLLQTADTGTPPPPSAANVAPTAPALVARPNAPMPPTPPRPMIPASGMAPPTSSGAAMAAPPPETTPENVSTEIPPPPTEDVAPAPQMREPGSAGPTP